MKIQIEYQTMDDLAREVCERCDRLAVAGHSLRLHPSLHDWVLDRTAPLSPPRVWAFSVTRGPDTMESVWEVIPTPTR